MRRVSNSLANTSGHARRMAATSIPPGAAAATGPTGATGAIGAPVPGSVESARLAGACGFASECRALSTGPVTETVAVGAGTGAGRSSSRGGAASSVESARLAGACGFASECRALSTGPTVPPTSRRRSMRSRRAACPLAPAAPGSRMRAAISSNCSRGAVAPVISVSPALTMSAARERAPAPKAMAWADIRSIWSLGTPLSTAAEPSGMAATTIRSRSRSSRSSMNRRGSRPVSMTRSIARKAPAASPAAKASIEASSNSPSVKPSSEAADS